MVGSGGDLGVLWRSACHRGIYCCAWKFSNLCFRSLIKYVEPIVVTIV